MKVLKMLPSLIFSILVLQLPAQNEIPKGFTKGILVLYDSTVVSGYIKDNMKKAAAVILLNETGGKNKSYDGDELIAAETDNNRFTCIKGDFFKIVCTGELCFLQKSSDASGKATYNGTEAIFISGTPGKPGDYFIYDSRVKQLKLVSNKTFATVTAGTFAGCAAAIEKAKSLQDDIARLSEAVEIYNGRGKK